MARTGRYEEEAPHKAGVGANRPRVRSALNDNKSYNQLLFHYVNYNIFFDINKVPQDDEKSKCQFSEYVSYESNNDLTEIKYTN